MKTIQEIHDKIIKAIKDDGALKDNLDKELKEYIESSTVEISDPTIVTVFGGYKCKTEIVLQLKIHGHEKILLISKRAYTQNNRLISYDITG